MSVDRGDSLDTPNHPTSLAIPKQIRFVSSDSQPHAKRRRINAACQTCRKRKTRCSGERPVCETCQQHGHACLGYAEIRPQQRDSESTPDPTLLDGQDVDTKKEHGHIVKLADGYSEQDRSPRIRRHGIRAADITHSRPGNGIDPSSTRPIDRPKDHATDYNLSNQGVDEEKPSPTVSSSHTSLNYSERNRVPYFRYFGPTAIVPGFKQMVVQVKDRRNTGEASTGALAGFTTALSNGSAATPSQSGTEPRLSAEIPFYDPNDPSPNHPLITHLVEIFFTHLGCNFPFLQRERFMQDMEDKRVDAILVDAVCAVAARFSTHPLLTAAYPSSPGSDRHEPKPKSEYGQAFAQRAKAAVVDTFSCPTTAVVQACLLLAYEEFGSNHDSGLWMYLGIAIRMAQDLGMQKLEGLRFEGREGPTPKSSKESNYNPRTHQEQTYHGKRESTVNGESPDMEEQRAVERERIDTFWAVFFLDRVISSGTGRPVTLRDRDVELSFPGQDSTDPITGWPEPFYVLIRIIHLYGRVTDLLNNIREVNHVTPETLKRLAKMESELTGIYQRLSPKLHFNAVNFQHYVKAGQGTNFILLHFWFHTLIVLLHQPSLLHSFDGRIQRLFPDSRELSMSSAKTIADILAFAELLDAKSFIGNPFTSQPMYIAACAFLKETEAHTASKPQSRAGTPPGQRTNRGTEQTRNPPSDGSSPSSHEQAPASNKAHENISNEQRSAKHTLLASAANQNYQRCYKALEALETYWAGTKYILTALDQKAQGIWDPLLYTSEEVMECATEIPHPEPSFTSPGWRRKIPLGGVGSSPASVGTTFNPAPFSQTSKLLQGRVDNVGSPMPDPTQAIGWSLTGTTNSPNSNLTFLYQHYNNPMEPFSTSQQIGQERFSGQTQILPTRNIGANETRTAPQPEERTSGGFGPSSFSAPASNSRLQGAVPRNQSLQRPADAVPASRPVVAPEPANASDAEMLLNLHSPYSGSLSSTQLVDTYNLDQPTFQTNMGFATTPASATGAIAFTPGGDMMLESQDIDMSLLGGDMIPWLEYLPQDWMNMFDNDDHGLPPSNGADPSGPL